MTIQFSDFLSDINNSVYSIPFFNVVLSSVIYTSIVLSILVLIMVLFICPSSEISTITFGKMFIYLFIVNTLVFSAHYSVMGNKLRESSNIQSGDEFISNISRRGGAYDKDNISVKPNFTPMEKFEEDRPEQIASRAEPVTVSEMLSSVERTL